ncbi:DUF4157 domain-containing protein [Corallococcus interemptor]|uniref:DUF4157 domain-containing protein n=1 Tax=Corallococcus interemptor TaxID=2316720 RepID=A0A3A8QWG4_9BACT|nr:DUF4157 domain-containing protein [Corallococcus interemptor]RKH73106.1 DUF4157 domain-containing protein [Corallococcus interemptor]
MGSRIFLERNRAGPAPATNGKRPQSSCAGCRDGHEALRRVLGDEQSPSSEAEQVPRGLPAASFDFAKIPLYSAKERELLPKAWSASAGGGGLEGEARRFVTQRFGSVSAAPRAAAGHAQLEAEAERLAFGGMTGQQARVLARPAAPAGVAERTLMAHALREPGSPFPAPVRASFAHRFGQPLEDVRLHVGEGADTVARALGARAFSFGAHVGFSHGAWAPESAEGRSLLAHELTHVLQQRGGPPALLRQEQPRGITFYFSVCVGQELDSDTLLLEFIRQYTRLQTLDEARAAREAADWRWAGTPQSASAEDVRRGYVLIHVRDRSLSATSPEEQAEIQEEVSGLDPAERDALHAEVDRRFWERTQYRPGERLGTSQDDRRMAEYWRHLRANLVRTRRALLSLPAHVRAILFDPRSTRHLSPADYDRALRVGQRLASLSAAELADWQSRIGGVTDDWATFESSLGNYLAEEAERRQESLERGRLSTRLYGLDEVYSLYRNMQATESLAGLPASDEFGVSDPDVVNARLEAPRMRETLEASLHAHGFASIAEFEQAIGAWRGAFERETVRVADVLLDRFDHLLFVAEQRYSDPAEAAALARAVAATGAPAHYAEADVQGERATWRPRHAMDEGGGFNDEVALEAAFASVEAERAGTEALRPLASDHPLLGLPDFPLERLGRAAPDDVQRLVLAYVSEHRASVVSTRAELHAGPSLIYKLDELLAASYEAQGITPGTIYDRIIRDHVSDEGIEALVEGLLLGVVTLALTVLSFGTGTLAAAAGVTAFGLSAWQAMDAWREYLRMERASDAQLLSEDPSIAWLVLAVVGAAADFGSALAAVRALRPAAEAFNTTGELAAFRRAVNEIPSLDARIASAANRAVNAEDALRQQWQALLGVATRANDIIGAVTEAGGRLMVMAWHLARRGYWRFDQFLAELRRAEFLLDIERLAPEELTALKRLHDEGLRRARDGFLPASGLSQELRAALSPDSIDDAAAYGRFLGLEDDEVLDVLEAQAVVARTQADALSPRALQSAMQERAAVPSAAEALVPDVRALPESRARTVGAIEQSYEIGVSEGRALLEGRGWRQWEHWINPFEFNGRYGQGLDDVFVDDAGRLWIVEYKGGTAELSPGQMSTRWVRRQIDRLFDAGHEATAARLREALDDGTLSGAVVSTPHGQPARLIQEFTYP